MTLAETQFNIRRGLFFAVVLTIVYYVGQFIITGGFNIIKYFFPAEAPIAEAKFGPLPRLKMYPLKIEGNPQYTIEIPQAEMPVFPDRVSVYKFVEPQPRFGAEDKVKDLAAFFKFESDFTKPSTTLYSWSDPNTGRSITADVLYKSFKMDIKFDNLLTISNNNPTILVSDATTKAINFVKSRDFLSASDTENLTSIAIPTNLSPGKLRESKIYQDRAQLIKVNIYRKLKVPKKGTNPEKPEFEEFPVLGPNPKDSLINFFVSGAQPPLDIPIANFIYWEVNTSEKSEYFISSLDSVWATVQQGNGVISYLKLDDADYYDSPKILNVNRVEIRKIYMAYYENKEYSPYLQPMYVFEGRVTTNASATETLAKSGDIIIYYPAIRGDFVQTQ